jgi:hypothetical protein
MKTPPLVIVLLAGFALSTSQAQAQLAAACPRTTASGEILGKPFPASEHWYGSETLAVMLPPNGMWRGMGSAHHYRDKLFWWSFGFTPGSESKLKVTGRKLDDTSAAANISRVTSAYASSLGGWTMLVAVEFPNAGCWEIAGEYLGQKLTFVVEVVADDVRHDT